MRINANTLHVISLNQFLNRFRESIQNENEANLLVEQIKSVL